MFSGAIKDSLGNIVESFENEPYENRAATCVWDCYWQGNEDY